MLQYYSLYIKNNFIQKLCFFVFLLSSFSNSCSAVCTATANGNWEDPTSWSCGHVPLCTDNINIPSGYTITVTTIYNYDTGPCASQPMTINISGVLKFITGKKLSLPSGSIIFINSGGSIQPGGGGGTSNLIAIGTIDVWKAADGPVLGPAIMTSAGLPIELVYFRSNISENNSINLLWQTATETNNNYFELERSDDGIMFEVISKIPSKSHNGNSQQTLNYETFDLTPHHGINYYRLKQVDYNSKFTYSQVLSIEFEGTNKFSFTVFPNPSEGGIFNIAWESPDKGEISVVVTDAIGEEYATKILITNETDRSIYAIDSSDKLAPGIYTIKATFIKRIYSKQLIVK